MLVQINGLQSEVMEYLLTFLYTARTTITPSNVQMLLEAANLFQIDLLKRKCTDFMYKQLDPCNCLGMKVSYHQNTDASATHGPYFLLQYIICEVLH